MQVTLKNFFDIVGISFIHTYVCECYVDEWDEDFEEFFPKQIYFEADIIGGNPKRYVTDVLRDLTPYMDYEIYKCNQKTEYGEIVEQTIYLKKLTT